MAGEPQLTPMMAQYRRIKADLSADTLLLFRLGDFYEMFFEDAQSGAQLLNVALTKRGVIPMCGIPFHAANAYIAKILKAGRKVAICDQVEDAKPGQLVKREVTQILSPGTHFDERILSAERNNFLAAIYSSGKSFGIAFVDLTTGDFKATEVTGEAALATELERIRPAEIIYPVEAVSLRAAIQSLPAVLNAYDDWVFAPETAVFTLRDHFKVAALDGFGLKGKYAAIAAAGAILHYLSQHLRRNIAHLTGMSSYESGDYLVLDSISLRNLEVLEPLNSDARRNASLYASANRTVTPMGARRLRDWLAQPLSRIDEILRRQGAVHGFLNHADALNGFRHALKEVRDLERTLSRLSVGTGNARDLQALALALKQVPALRATVEMIALPAKHSNNLEQVLSESWANPTEQPIALPTLLEELAARLLDFPALVQMLDRGIAGEPPLALKEGGMIRAGFDETLDELRRATHEGKDWIAKLQQQEIEQTGISSLKIRYNSVFGYYIEITRSNLDKVPPHYIRKQTIANGERFITPALKEMEGKILGSEERSVKLEYEIFLRLREQVIAQLAGIQQTAQVLARLDVLSTFAETARLYGYCAPQMRDEGTIEIQDGRHPVLDQILTDERFVSNDTHLDRAKQQIVLITGPNMAGKSTYIRQVALLTLLAHTGSFIPAKSARIDLVDRIFTRIGASDDLSRGQSTFMVEMSETANILNNSTARSLVILDEIGRGTSTFDGLSLAWSIVEHIHNISGAKTLFATHYHELTELAGRLARVRNFNVAVREWNDQIIFLRKIVEGGTDKSYGIQVARLAGIPRSVVERAKEILSNLEEAELTPEGRTRSSSRQRGEREKLQKLTPPPQLDLFSR